MRRQTKATKVTSAQVLKAIKTLNKQFSTKNYLPMPLLRKHFAELTRKQLDELVCELIQKGKIYMEELPAEIKKLWDKKEVKQGIGNLFFVVVR